MKEDIKDILKVIGFTFIISLICVILTVLIIEITVQYSSIFGMICLIGLPCIVFGITAIICIIIDNKK